MSTLKVDQIEGSTGTTVTIPSGTTIVNSGTATNFAHTKAWATVTYSGGTPTNEDGLNIASIADTAAGECTLTFTTSFGDAEDYCITTGTLNTSASQEQITIYTKATGNFKTYNYNSGGAGGIDPEAFYISCSGDLA